MVQSNTEPATTFGPVDMKELARILIRHAGIEEGHHQVVVEFVFTTGLAGPSKEEMYPTAFTGIKSVSLVRVNEPTPISVDAASLGD